MKKAIILNIILLILIKLVLEYAYIEYIVKFYEYAGFHYAFSYDKYLFGWLVYIFGYILLRKKQTLYIYEIFLFLFFLYILPNIIYYSLSDQNTYFFIGIISPFFIIITFLTQKNVFRVSTLKKGKPIILILSFILSITVVIHYIINTHGHMVLNLKDVYVYRDAYDHGNQAGIFGYINSWASKIFVVLLFAWAVSEKKLFFILIALLLILMMFAFSGHKSILQGIFLVIFFYFLSFAKNKDTLVMIGFFFLIVVSIILAEYLNLEIIVSLIVRRLLFLPAQLNFIYFDFFSTHEYFYWSNSIFKFFISSIYDKGPTYVIGEYLGHPEANMNIGFVASGFAHAGYLGVLVYTFIGFIILTIINTLSKKMNKYIVFSIIFIPINALFVSSDMLTILLTHGLMVILLVLWMYEDKIYKLKIGRLRYKF